MGQPTAPQRGVPEMTTRHIRRMKDPPSLDYDWDAYGLLMCIQRDYPDVKKVVHLDPGLLFWRIVIPPDLSLQRWLVNPESAPLSVVMKTIDVPLTRSIAQGRRLWLVGVHDDTAYLSKVK